MYKSITDGYIHCVACLLTPLHRHPGQFENVLLLSYQEALDHLIEHRKSKHLVPKYAFTKIKAEIELYGNESFIDARKVNNNPAFICVEASKDRKLL